MKSIAGALHPDIFEQPAEAQNDFLQQPTPVHS
jgi:hypothetical protein